MELSTDLTPSAVRRNILRLAWPAVVRMVFQMLEGVVSLVVVGHLGAAAIAGVGISNRIFFLILAGLTAVTTGTTAVVAHRIGAGREDEARVVTAQSLTVSLAFGFVMAGFAYLAGHWLIASIMFADPDPEVIRLGSTYLNIVMIGMILGFPMMMVNGALQGAGDMKTPMYLMFGINLINICLAYPLTYGLGSFAGLGLAGAALAQGISRIVGGIAGFAVMFSSRWGRLQLQWGTEFVPRREVLRDVISIGLPAAGENLVRQSSQILYTMVVASMGTVVIAANQVVMSVQSLSFQPGFGFSIAATALVGQSLGATRKDLAARYGSETTKLGAAFMGLMGIVFMLFARPLATLYTNDVDVVNAAATCVRIVGIAQIPMAIVIILDGALRGAGDTKFVMYLTAVGQWGIRLVFAIALGLWAGMGLTGVWIAFAMDSTVRSVLTLWRFRSNKWQEVFDRLQAQGGKRRRLPGRVGRQGGRAAN